jgi:pimeloyl-ACP methyl ester carboxylesterase
MAEKNLRSKIMEFLVVFGLVLIGLVLFITAGAVITENFVYTPAFKGADGKKLPGSIAEFRRVNLGGISQAILVRGKNLDNPVLLFLHAGPGLSETSLMRNMNSVLENYYTMVYLDQRGGGKSYSLFDDYKNFTTKQLVQDIHELTQYLKKRFNKEKIIIMGHCFGAGFGALTAAIYPDDYSLFIAIAQPVCPVDIDRLSNAWNIEQAKREVNDKAIKELESVNGFWNLKEPKGYFNGMMVNKKWVGYYGGMIAGKKGFVSFVLKNLLSLEYSVFDYTPYMLGMTFGGPAAWEIMITTDFRKQVPEFKCPIIFLQGRQDYNVVPEFTKEYFNTVKAPYKKMYWFEKSAHFLHIEEKELFQKVMIDDVLPVAKGIYTR